MIIIAFLFGVGLVAILDGIFELALRLRRQQ